MKGQALGLTGDLGGTPWLLCLRGQVRHSLWGGASLPAGKCLWGVEGPVPHPPLLPLGQDNGVGGVVEGDLAVASSQCPLHWEAHSQDQDTAGVTPSFSTGDWGRGGGIKGGRKGGSGGRREKKQEKGGRTRRKERKRGRGKSRVF